MPPLVGPHGGVLVDRIVPEHEAPALRARAEALPVLALDARELCDLELIATGAVSPLTGFVGSADYRSVLERMRLAGGTVWPLPLTLCATDAQAARLAPGSEAALCDPSGRPCGVIEVEETFRRDRWPLEAQRIFDRFGVDELGVQPLRFENTFCCRACENPASTRTCPHETAYRLELSGTRVREILRSGGRLPHEFTRPEVAEILRTHLAPDAQPAPAVKPSQRGFIVWLTGLSGAGKTTLARALRRELAGERRLEVLDGDEVRTYLSSDLGFSREIAHFTSTDGKSTESPQRRAAWASR